MKKRRNPHPKREPVDTGTEQTVKKLKTDVVLKLYEAGRLTKGQLSAAEEIREVFACVESALLSFSRASPEGAAPYRSAPLAPMERMSKEQYVAWRDHYMPWQRNLPMGNLAVVIEVVIDNRGPFQIEEANGWKLGKTVTPMLKKALQAYAERAGLATRRAA